MLGMTFSRAWSNHGRRTRQRATTHDARLDSERLCSKTAPAEFYRSARFALIMPSRRRGVARIFAYDRGTAPQVTPACLICCHDSLTGGARGKFMGLRDPFTILRNVRDTTSPTAPSVDLVRFPSWRIACIKPNTACSACHHKQERDSRLL